MSIPIDDQDLQRDPQPEPDTSVIPESPTDTASLLTHINHGESPSRLADNTTGTTIRVQDSDSISLLDSDIISPQDSDSISLLDSDSISPQDSNSISPQDSDSISFQDSDSISLDESRIDLQDTSRLLESQLNTFFSHRLSDLLEQTDELEKLAQWQRLNMVPIQPSSPPTARSVARPFQLLSLGHSRASGSLQPRTNNFGDSHRSFSTHALARRAFKASPAEKEQFGDETQAAVVEPEERRPNILHRAIHKVEDYWHRKYPPPSIPAHPSRVMQIFGEPSAVHPDRFCRYLVEVRLEKPSESDETPQADERFFLILDSGSGVTWIRSLAEESRAAEPPNPGPKKPKKKNPKGPHVELKTQDDKASLWKQMIAKFRGPETRPVYNPGLRKAMGSGIHIEKVYGSGKIQYEVYHDHLRVGTLPPTKQTIGAAPLNFMCDDLRGSGVEGLLALGRDGTENEELKPIVRSICNELLRGFRAAEEAPQLLPHPYVVLIGPHRKTTDDDPDQVPNARGHLAVGVLDPTLWSGHMSWFEYPPLLPGEKLRTEWVVSLNQVYINDKPLFEDGNPRSAILDTGSSWVHTADSYCEKIAEMVGGKILHHAVGMAGRSNKIAYNRREIRSVTFEFGNPETYSFFRCVVPGRVAALDDTTGQFQNPDMCWSFIQPQSGCHSNFWVIGGIVIERFVTAFDYSHETPRIGLAELPTNPVDLSDSKWIIQ